MLVGLATIRSRSDGRNNPCLAMVFDNGIDIFLLYFGRMVYARNDLGVVCDKMSLVGVDS
jgi:hypothetical protein